MKLTTIIALIIMLGLMAFVFTLIIFNIITLTNDCLIETAKNYCEANGYIYESVSWEMGAVFYCDLNERKFSLEKFKFLDEEKERCKND